LEAIELVFVIKSEHFADTYPARTRVDCGLLSKEFETIGNPNIRVIQLVIVGICYIILRGIYGGDDCVEMDGDFLDLFDSYEAARSIRRTQYE
jgi:hypothetical protein